MSAPSVKPLAKLPIEPSANPSIAPHMTNSALEDEYIVFCQAIHKDSGIDLLSYKRNQMERRIRFMASQAGEDGLMGFLRKLRSDATLFRSFIDKLTINVSEFFRNPDKYSELKRDILPNLLKNSRPLSVWSAGCSYGAEPYTLRIILHQLSPHRIHNVLATDIDEVILTRARQGRFAASELANFSEAERKEYFTEEGGVFEIAQHLRRGVEFKKHDLLRDTYPSQVDLVLCRNVVIYFSDAARHHVHKGFFESLRPGGYLFIGSSERVSQNDEIGFIQHSPFIYRKPTTHS